MNNKTHEQTAEFFDRIAEDYRTRSEGRIWNTSSLSFARRQELVERALGDLPERTLVLDYGMGPAVFADYVVNRNGRYIGIDISQKMIELAEAKKLKGCTFVKGDLGVLPDYAGKADRVLLIGLLDYLEDPYAGLKALGDCVTPGGWIIMSFRNKFSLPFMLREVSKKLWRLLRGQNGQTDKAFNADVLENAFSAKRDLLPFLESIGFERPSVSYLDASPIFFRVNLPCWLWKKLFILDKVISRSWLSFFAASGVLKAAKSGLWKKG